MSFIGHKPRVDELRGASSLSTPTLSTRRRKVVIDFETRSHISVRDVGAWKYASHKSTQVVCLSWSFEDEDEVHTWHPAFPSCGLEEATEPHELLNAIEDGCLVEAHNCMFERAVWERVLLKKHCKHWPEIKPDQWRCSAALAASYALPRALEDVCKVLRLKEQKDIGDGHKAMLKLSKPRRVSKKYPEGGWVEEIDLLEKCFEYNRQDVRAEKAVLRRLGELGGTELALWHMDQTLNARGVYIDRAGCERAISIISEIVGKLHARLSEVTGGLIVKATDRSKIKDFCLAAGYPIPDTKGETVDAVLDKNDVPGPVREVLSICRQVNRSSTAKYKAMLARILSDDRARDLMMFHGASTGRWTGKGFQVHNFPRGKIKDMAGAWWDIHHGDLDWLQFMYGDVMEFFSHATRGAICAAPGRDLIVADYAAIEARVLFWLADEKEALGVFERGEDIYCYMADVIYGYETHKDTHPMERQLGKQAVLGLGYQMGAQKFMDTCAKYGIVISFKMAERVVKAYRAKYHKVKKLWKDIEIAAIECVRTKRDVKLGKITWMMRGDFLQCRLPSGRCLHYYRPSVGKKTTPWGSEADVLHFWSVDDKGRWRLEDTYGGKLVENVVQAIARDLMAMAMLRAEASEEYDLLMSVHDELVCEVDKLLGDVKKFEAMMSELPRWAKGCPVTAEGWRGPRYKK